MDPISYSNMIDGILDEGMFFSIVYLINVMGAFSKDYYNTLKHKKPKIEIMRVIFSALITTFIPYMFSDYFSHVRLLVGFSFFSGFLSYSMIEYLSDFSKVVDIIDRLKSFWR